MAVDIDLAERTNPMAVSIQFARSPESLDALFRARHFVLAELSGCAVPTDTYRLQDRFDDLPTTRNVIAEHHGGVIGGVRITLPSSAGTPLARRFDVAEFVEELRYAVVSLLFLEPLYRGTGLSRQLLHFGASWASLNRCTHLIAVAPRATLPAFTRSGFRLLANTGASDPAALVPAALDLRPLGGYLQLLSLGLTPQLPSPPSSTPHAPLPITTQSLIPNP